MTIVQICGCTEDGEDVTPFVSNQQAQFYGLYLSQPDGCFVWQEDFRSLANARLAAANAIARGDAQELDDKTFDEDTQNA